MWLPFFITLIPVIILIDNFAAAAPPWNCGKKEVAALSPGQKALLDDFNAWLADEGRSSNRGVFFSPDQRACIGEAVEKAVRGGTSLVDLHIAFFDASGHGPSGSHVEEEEVEEMEKNPFVGLEDKIVGVVRSDSNEEPLRDLLFEWPAGGFSHLHGHHTIQAENMKLRE